MANFSELRHRMVDEQLKSRDIEDPAVLKAMGEVPREEFVPVDLADLAYGDAPLPIGEGQTISQPYIVAYMTEALEISPTDKVLEIGTGCGYAAAVLSRIAAEVYTVERHATLTETAKRHFERLGYRNIHLLHGDGSLGWPEKAPYDGIVATACSPDVPHPLEEQLAIGGRMVIPIGSNPRFQTLIRLRRKTEHELKREEMIHVSFVPLIGAAGWSPEEVS